MKVFEALADALVAEGAQRVFCVMGDGNLDLLIALHRRGVELVHARHEQHAVAMADGYSRAGRLGLCSVTHGPGLTQTGTSLVAARARRSPLLLLAGDTPTANKAHVQNFDQLSYARATAGTYVDVASPAAALDDLRRALCDMRSLPGPVVLNLPTDVQLSSVQDGIERWTPVDSVGALVPHPDSVAESARLLSDASRPVLLAGRGAVGEGSPDAVAELSCATGAPIVTTVLAKGLLSDHPNSVGVSGGFGTPAAREALEQSDLILALGTSLSSWTTRSGALLDGRSLVLVDVEADRWAGTREPDVRVRGDVGITAAAIAAQLPAPAPAAWFERSGRVLQQPGVADDDGMLDPRLAFAALDKALPEQRTIVVDGGHFTGFACEYLGVRTPEQFVFGPDFGAVGQGLALAIGVACARGRTTLVVGDGGFLMTVQELDTAVRHDVPLTVVVVNDGGCGQEYHSLLAKGLPPEQALFATPDLAALADAFGAHGRLVRRAADLDALSEILADPEGVVVIDLQVTRQVVHPAAAEIFAAIRRGT